MAAKLNQKFAKYDLLKRLAIGGMGEIFLARHRGVAGFERLVVVKQLIAELAEQPDVVALFVDEARIAAYLNHPNIVQVHEFGQERGTYFLTMEYVHGQNLSRILKRMFREGKTLDRNLAVHIVAEMAEALDFAHNARDAEGHPLGIVHRDVSPHNLLISFRGDVKLMDFGIAKATNASHRTDTGVLRGKISYMSPEQIGGNVDARSDVFSAGIVLWELTLGSRLFKTSRELDALQLVCTAEIPRPRSIFPDYPEELEEIVMAALERDLSRRLPSARLLADGLHASLKSSGQSIRKQDLGALVQRLFPEDSLPTDDVAAAEGTSSQALTREMESTGDRLQSTASALPPGQPAAADTTAPTPPRSKLLFPVFAVVAGCAIAALLWVRNLNSHAPPPSVQPAIVASSPGAASPVPDRGPSPGPVASSSPAPVVEPGKATKALPDHHEKRSRTEKSHPAPTRVTASPAPPPTATEPIPQPPLLNP